MLLGIFVKLYNATKDINKKKTIDPRDKDKETSLDEFNKQTKQERKKEDGNKKSR